MNVPVMKNIDQIWHSEGAKIQDGHHGFLKNQEYQPNYQYF